MPDPITINVNADTEEAVRSIDEVAEAVERLNSALTQLETHLVLRS